MRSPTFFVTVSILWACLASVASLGLVKAGLHSEIAFAIKDIPIYLLAAMSARLWLATKGAVFSALLVALSCVLLFVNFYALNPDYSAPLNNVRQIIAPLVLLLIFCGIRVDDSDLPRIGHLIAIVTLSVFAFGFIEQVGGIWAKVDLSMYFFLKGIPTDGNGLSFMFYEPMFGYRQRMSATFLDPISAGHFFATAFLFLFYARSSSRVTQFALVAAAVGVVLTMSKGAMLQMFLGVTVLNPRVPLMLRLISISVPFLIIPLLPNRDGLEIHFQGLANAVRSISLFGHGIGSSGNYAKMFSENMMSYNALGISDTYVGALLGQIGIVGLFVWLGVALFILFFRLHMRRCVGPSVRIFVSIFAVSVLSENTMNVTSFLAPAILIGLAGAARVRVLSIPTPFEEPRRVAMRADLHGATV